MMDIDGPRLPPADGGAVRALVVLLHGYGANGDDLIGLAPHLADVLPHAAFVSPHAPFPCEMAPGGRQWFGLADRSPEAMLAGVRMAAQTLNSFLDAELTRAGITADRLALIGFSQGTMMALHVGPRRTEALAGIVGYSGRLIAPELLAGEITAKPPVTLIHGDMDEMIPPDALSHAEAGLAAAGIAVATDLRPGLGHGIDGPGLTQGAAFLQKVLPL